MSLNLKSLVGKLTDSARRGLEGAAGLCLSRTNYEVEMEHWFFKLAEPPDGDVSRILRHFEIEPDRFLRDIERALGRLRTGNGGRPQLAPSIEDLAREGWVLASINYGTGRARSGVLFLAAMQHPSLRRRLVEICEGVRQVQAEALGSQLLQIVGGSPEDREVLSGAESGERPIASGAPGDSRTPALDQFTIDLTSAARAGRIDPVLGRDAEIRQIVDILSRRRQNNPILTGEAGVGKTAVVEGFAGRIVSGDVPEPLRNVALRTLDLGLLQAGAGIKGEFENRLKQVIAEVRGSPQPIILFIDEAHTLIGAGGQEGQGDAANLLKPALARGELRTIAATTWAEYKRFFEKDAALSRRFQVVKVEEPSESHAIVMMRGIVSKLEEHHRVRILDEAVVESVRLSHRYIPARQLPDKSVSVLDTACARVALAQSTTAPPIEDLHRRIESLDTEIGILERESSLGSDHTERLREARRARETSEMSLRALEERLQKERAVLEGILALRRRIESASAVTEPVRPETGTRSERGAAAGPERERGEPTEPGRKGDTARVEPHAAPHELPELRRELASLQNQLREVQGEQPLVQVDVQGQTIAEVISAWTGIPVGRMVADEIQTVLDLPKKLGERVLGQDHALEDIARRIRTSRADLENPARPVGVFLLVGPSGVGKTETALALAEILYGGERNMVTLNMSEYQESHTVSKLKGSPPGYVGYGEGGVLTEAVRRRPYSVVLLDEVEKAHSDVLELFFQVFDRGMLEDGEGREIDFKNTVILLTSNVGTDVITKLCADPDTSPEPEGLREAVRPALQKQFPLAFLGRLIVVPYYPISPDIMRRIIALQLDRVRRRILENHRARLVYDETLVDAVAKRCTEPESGARNVDQILTRTLLPEISTEFLSRMATGRAFSQVEVSVTASGAFQYRIT